MHKWRIAILSMLLLGISYVGFLIYSFQELDRAFLNINEFLPTRIYSDVTPIAPPMSRSAVKQRLKSLKYKFSEEENILSFTLHNVEYPSQLVSPDHPIDSLRGKTITLLFDSPEKQSTLISITTENFDLEEVFLEPQLVATLKRGSQDETSDNKVRKLLKFEEFPASVWQSIIAVEDQHFLEHSGLDPRGFARAMWINLKTFSLSQGGSTITQQLVKNLMVRRTKNIFKKVSEIFLSLMLEWKYDKEKILERYLNEVYLGQIGSLEIHGVAEGAKYFFGKTLEDLNMGEIALMSGLIRGPSYYSPYRHLDRAQERQRFILDRMVDTGHIAREEAEFAKKEKIRLVPPPKFGNSAPYFTDFVKAQVLNKLKNQISEQEITQSGFRIYTTLDPLLNRHAQKLMDDGIERVEKRFGLVAAGHLEGALASVDHRNGYIRALIGGRNYARSNFNRILNMKRQVGSTFKPVVYLSALQKGFDKNGVPYGAGYPIEDAKWTLIFDRNKQKWSPRNYQKEYKGWITFREALINSVNVPAAKIGFDVGVDRIIKTARQLGIESDLPAVPSLALGVTELSPVELLKLYSTIANRGVQDELTAIRAITRNDGSLFAEFIYHPQEVFDPRYTDLITDLMKGVFIDGTAHMASSYGFNETAAGKTGTTNDHRDSWFAGFTAELTTVVWVGIEKGTAPIRLTGAGSALPVWISYMKKALSLLPRAEMAKSDYLESVPINKTTGQLATSDCPSEFVSVENYLIGETPREETCVEEYPETISVTREE